MSELKKIFKLFKKNNAMVKILLTGTVESF